MRNPSGKAMADTLPQVSAVTCLADYKLQFIFTDGRQGIVDLQPLLNFGVFTKLAEKALFKQARVVFGCVEWPGGIDLDPEWLYLHATTSQVAEKPATYNPQ